MLRAVACHEVQGVLDRVWKSVRMLLIFVIRNLRQRHFEEKVKFSGEFVPLLKYSSGPCPVRRRTFVVEADAQSESNVGMQRL